MGVLRLGNNIVIPTVPTGTADIPKKVDTDGVLKPAPVANYAVPESAVDIGTNALRYAFQGSEDLETFEAPSVVDLSGDSCLASVCDSCPNLTTINFNSLESVSGSQAMSQSFSNTGLVSISFPELVEISGYYGMDHAFSNCTSLVSVSFPKLQAISDSVGLSNAFLGCTNLRTADFSVLETVASSGFSNGFSGCTNLTSINLSKLHTVGSYAFQNLFNMCRNLTTVRFDSLNNITANNCLQQCFTNCTSLKSIYFPALNYESIGAYQNQFYRMLTNVSGCTVHFPENLEGMLGGIPDVMSGFGGVGTTVLFDLPSTEE